MTERFFEVAINSPLNQTYTYKLLTLEDEVRDYSGHFVKVTLRRQVTEGVILHEVKKPDVKYEIKEIHELSTDAQPISKVYLDWLKWISDYYMYPLGQTLSQMFPPLKKEGGKTRKASPVPPVARKDFVKLSDEQNDAFEKISSLKGFQSHLLWGITGSGKTEVYLELLKKVISEGKQGLVLVPEISLTPQLLRRFSERFGDEVAVIHSHLTEREKTNQWWSVVDGKKKILIGARSALFCPFPNLGMIVIDEEHEASFKQDEKLKYHARDCAIMLAKNLDIPIVLGSATPSIESWKNTKDGKYHLHHLRNRIASAQLPKIEVLDMREKDKEKHPNLPQWMTADLYEKIKERLSNKEQVALFLNRRGLSQIVMCRECGETSGCPNCDVSLSLHARVHLVCHYCGYTENLKTTCGVCKIGEPKPIGIGTEKIEEEIKELFPNAKTIRLDRDEIYNRETLEQAIQAVESGEADILIGTQMIAKGLDFPKLTLVGIVLADIGFSFPDFRSAERNFQLLSQVSGRPGRHSMNGEVIIQTYNPEYTSLVYAQKNDYPGFADQELKNREELNYPPYGRLASIRIQGLDLKKVNLAASLIEKNSAALQKKFPNLTVLGPVQSPIFKLKNKYRYNLLIKSKTAKSIRDFCSYLFKNTDLASGIQVSIDIDPMNTF
jgi:primosomal protein N' (replication factor Y)